MKHFMSVETNEFVLTSDQETFSGDFPSATLRFRLNGDFVKIIIETGLANVSLSDLIREHIEQRFSREAQKAISAKESLYEKAALILGERQGDADVSERNAARGKAFPRSWPLRCNRCRQLLVFDRLIEVITCPHCGLTQDRGPSVAAADEAEISCNC